MPHSRYSFDLVELGCRQHDAELRHSREECWARQQEVAAAREKLAHLKTTLEDRRKDVVSYKVTKLVASQNDRLLWLFRAGKHHKWHSCSNKRGSFGGPQPRKMEQADSAHESQRDGLTGLSV